MSGTDVAERPTNPVAIFRQQVEARQQEFAAALPAHIPAERFVRVILTAVNKNPSLLAKCVRDVNILTIENVPNLGQGKTDEFQRHDLFET